MKINVKNSLFLRDIYSYDIVSCHYTILENLGVDLSEIPADAKLERNIKIGLLMRDNPKLTNILRSVTDSTISEYILRNDLKEEEIVLRQYDGIITTKPLQETTDRYIPLELRMLIQHMIVSIDKDMYIAFNGMKTVVKGVPYLYDKMEHVYNKIARINFLNKPAIFNSLQRIRDEIFKSEDPLLYVIPTSKEKSSVFLKQYGEVQIAQSAAKYIDVEDIDREKYFDMYIQPFFKSIVKEFV